MADLSDVTNALAQLASNALYPNGEESPSVVAGVTITVATGWPIPAQLDEILAAKNAMLTVYPMPGMDANTTRFPLDFQVQNTIPAANLSLAVSGSQVTVGGTIKEGEAPTVFVNYKPYSVAVGASDTTATIAAALRALIPGAGGSGSVITISGIFSLSAVVSVPVVMQSEIGRQTRVFMLSAWCASPATRDAVIKAVDGAFRPQKRIVLPDNTYARMIYRGTLQTDDAAKQRIYRRDLRYEIEYATTMIETDNTVTNLGINGTPDNGAAFTVNI